MAYTSSFGDVDEGLNFDLLIGYLVDKMMKSGFPIDLGFTTFRLSLDALLPGPLEQVVRGVVTGVIINEAKDYFTITDKVTSHSIAYSIAVSAYIGMWDVVKQQYPLESSQAENDSISESFSRLGNPAYLLCATLKPNGIASIYFIGSGPDDMGVFPTFIANQMENFAEEMGYTIPETTPDFIFPEDEVETGAGTGTGIVMGGQGIKWETEVISEVEIRRQAMLDGITVSTWKPPSSGSSMILLGAAGIAALILLRK